ncbi:MAG: hypothetical protein HXM21_00410 [Haemophilus influenzae]|nr:hypothetical protein [Haemophilus influenzae]
MTTYNEKLIALENILGKNAKEIEKLKSEKIAFSDEEKATLKNALHTNYSTAFQIREMLRNNQSFYVSLLLSEVDRNTENMNSFKAIFGDITPNRSAVRVKEVNKELSDFCNALGLEINEELKLVFCTENRAQNTTLRDKVVALGLMVNPKVNYKMPEFQALVKFLDELRNDLNGEIGQKEKGKGKKEDQILRELKYIEEKFSSQWNEEEQQSILKTLEATLKAVKKQIKK